MSTQKREFSKKRRNGTMRRKMKGGVWYNPMTWTSSSTTSTAEVPAQPVVDASGKPKQSWSEWFNSLGKSKPPAGSAAPSTEGAPAPAVTVQPNQGGGKRKNKRSRNSKK
jgi:hypothetical protein